MVINAELLDLAIHTVIIIFIELPFKLLAVPFELHPELLAPVFAHTCPTLLIRRQGQRHRLVFALRAW